MSRVFQLLRRDALKLSSRGTADALTIYYASDIHGSDVLWKKFLNAAAFYGANVLVMGGDMTGKAIVPVIHNGNGHWRATFLGRTFNLSGDVEVGALESDIRFNGMYPYRCEHEDFERLANSAMHRDALFDELMVRNFRRWLDLANDRLEGRAVQCYAMPGNDDTWVIDKAFKAEDTVKNCDARVIDLGSGYSMLSLGYSNPTPWLSPRELPESQLSERIEELASEVPDMGRAIFNLHVPPIASGLDDAPVLDANMKPRDHHTTSPVGSTAVREAIEKHQPLLTLHGHIHECMAFSRIGRTLCVNPGSNYNTGRIDGVLIRLEHGQIKRHQFVHG